MSSNRSIREALTRFDLFRNKTNQGRELVNNPQLYQDVIYKMSKFLQCIHMSIRYNAIFGTEHLNDGIMEAAVRNSNVGGCANAGKFTRGNVISSDE